MAPPKYTGKFQERYVVWNAHNGVCCYCEYFHPLDSSEIDHIIPRNYGRTDKLYELTFLQNQISKLFEFPQGWGIDTYYNVVPSCRSCNRQKWHQDLPLRETVNFLRIARYKYPEIERTYRYINRSRSKAEVQAILSRSLEEGVITKEDIQSIVPIEIDYFSKTAVVELDAPLRTATVSLGIAGNIDDIYEFEQTLNSFAEYQHEIASDIDVWAVSGMMQKIVNELKNPRCLYTGIKSHENNDLLLLPGKPNEIQLFLPHS